MARPLPVRPAPTQNADLVAELRRRTGMDMFGASSILKPQAEPRRILARDELHAESDAPAPRFGM